MHTGPAASPANTARTFKVAGIKPGDTVVSYCHLGQQRRHTHADTSRYLSLVSRKIRSRPDLSIKTEGRLRWLASATRLVMGSNSEFPRSP